MPNTSKRVEIDPVREKLIDVCKQANDELRLRPGCSTWGDFADCLIANGVTVKIKKEKPPVDLSGKCGSCVYASMEQKELWLHLQSYVRCVNPEKRFMRKNSEYKARTTPCCKAYKPKGEPK